MSKPPPGFDPPNSIAEDDLLALVDDRLDPERRQIVEARVRNHPSLATRILQDQWNRGEVRRFLGHRELPADLARLGRRLQRRMMFARVLNLVRPAAAAASLIAFGWIAHGLISGPSATPAHASISVPAYVDDAVEAYRRAEALGTPAPITPADASIRFSRWVGQGEKAVPIPEIPGDSAILGVTADPRSRPRALKVFYQVGADTALLYVVGSQMPRSMAPRLAVKDSTSIAYWQMGEHSYAMVGLPPKRLLEVARIMAFAM